MSALRGLVVQGLGCGVARDSRAICHAFSVDSGNFVVTPLGGNAEVLSRSECLVEWLSTTLSSGP